MSGVPCMFLEKAVSNGNSLLFFPDRSDGVECLTNRLHLSLPHQYFRQALGSEAKMLGNLGGGT